MKSRSTYLMIFLAFCISLLMGYLAHPSYAARGADNNPDKVQRAIERASADRRFIYPEKDVEFDLHSEELLRRLTEWEEERRKEMANKAAQRDRDRKWDERRRRFREGDDREGWGGPMGEGNGGDGEGTSGGTKLDLKVLTYILYGFAVCVLAFIIYRLVLFYYPRLRGGPGDESGAAGVVYESLDPAEQLSLAEQLLRQGRWAEALSAMMMSLLLTLDTRRIIRYHRSRTNREYLWPLKKHPILFAVAREFVHNFEDMKYGYRTPDREGATYMFDLFKQAEAAIPKPTQEESSTEG